MPSGDYNMEVAVLDQIIESSLPVSQMVTQLTVLFKDNFNLASDLSDSIAVKKAIDSSLDELMRKFDVRSFLRERVKIMKRDRENNSNKNREIVDTETESSLNIKEFSQENQNSVIVPMYSSTEPIPLQRTKKNQKNKSPTKVFEINEEVAEEQSSEIEKSGKGSPPLKMKELLSKCQRFDAGFEIEIQEDDYDFEAGTSKSNSPPNKDFSIHKSSIGGKSPEYDDSFLDDEDDMDDENNINRKTDVNASISSDNIYSSQIGSEENKEEKRNDKISRNGAKAVKFIPDVVSEVMYRDKNTREEAAILFYTQREADKFQYDFEIESMKAERCGLSWINWMSTRTDDDIKTEEEEEEKERLSRRIESQGDDDDEDDKYNYNFDDSGDDRFGALEKNDEGEDGSGGDDYIEEFESRSRSDSGTDSDYDF